MDATFYINWKPVFLSYSEIICSATGFTLSVIFDFTDLLTLPTFNLCTHFYMNKYFYQELHLYTETKIPVLYPTWKIITFTKSRSLFNVGLHSWKFQQCRTQTGTFFTTTIKIQQVLAAEDLASCQQKH